MILSSWSLFAIVIWASAFAQDVTPQIHDASIDVQVRFDSTTAIYEYEYTVKNGQRSSGKVQNFGIDITRSSGSVELGESGLTIPRGGERVPFTESIIQGTTVHLVPIGMDAPQSWTTGISVSGLASFFGRRTALVAPSQAKSGFKIRSRGLPGIRQAVVDPFFVFRTSGAEATEEDERRAEQQGEKMRFSTTTIGPVAPLGLDASSLIQTLIGMKHHSADLGWLGDAKFVAKLDKRLDQAKAALARDKKKLARVRLSQFVHELEKAHEEHKDDDDGHRHGKDKRRDKKFVNDEAFQLLKLNAEFIIAKLPTKGKDRNEEDECRRAESEKDDDRDEHRKKDDDRRGGKGHDR